MDELKVKSAFLRNILGKILVKTLKEKISEKIVDVDINDLEVTVNENDSGLIEIHLDLDACAKKELIGELIFKDK